MPTHNADHTKSRLKRIKEHANESISTLQSYMTKRAKKSRKSARKISKSDKKAIRKRLKAADDAVAGIEIKDEDKEPSTTAERAGQAARMGPPIEAKLDPLEAPEESHALAGGRGQMGVSGRRGGQMADVDLGISVTPSSSVSEGDPEFEPLAAAGMSDLDSLVGGGGQPSDREGDRNPLWIETGFAFGFGGED